MRDLTGCSIGSDCRLGNTTSQQFFRAVIDGLRSRGICAGQHEPRFTDEIAVGANRSSKREGYHVFGGDDSDGPVPPGGTIRKVVWSPGAARPSYYGNAEPPPVDPPPANPGSCSAPLPPKVWTAGTLPPNWGENEIGQPRWIIGCGPHPNGRVIDCSANVAPHACGYCDSIGMGEAGGQIRCGCPVRNECKPVDQTPPQNFKCEERVACEQYLTGGTKLVKKDGFTGTCSFANSNPFQFEPSGGQCKLCSVEDPRVCGGWF
jgi:hypothetical protein